MLNVNMINRYSFLITFLACLLFSPLVSALVEKPFVVIIPSYNNIECYEKNLDSIFSQNYTNYRIIYIDDSSTDGTFEAVDKYVKEKNQNFRVKVFRNSEKSGALANIYWAVNTCREHEICVLVDGDDWLLHQQVFKELNEAYANSDVWFTHGSQIEYPDQQVKLSFPILPETIVNKSYRQNACPSHLQTFYTWLFKRIRLHDFLYQGKFISTAVNLAIMYPLLEMAEERHAFISNPNYVHNMANPLNTIKLDPTKKEFVEKTIRSRQPYKRLENPDVPRWLMEGKQKR